MTSSGAIQGLTAWHLLVSGRVQGVGYRVFVARAAQANRVVGWVRNLTDGRVECWCQGSNANLKALHQMMLSGPRHAKVDAIEMKQVAHPTEMSEFEIREDGELPWSEN